LNKFIITDFIINLWQVFTKSFLVFQKAEIAKSLWLINVCGIGFVCINFRLSSVTSVILVLCKTSFVSVFAKIGLCSWGVQDQQSWCCCVDQGECVSWGVQDHSLGCCVSDQVVIA